MASAVHARCGRPTAAGRAVAAETRCPPLLQARKQLVLAERVVAVELRRERHIRAACGGNVTGGGGAQQEA